jgi:GT2 family glycosyltransferase
VKNTIKVGYVGAIAEWFDADLVEEVAKKKSEFEFHLCGEVTASNPMKLGKIKNIHLHGEISYADVPGFLHEMDVLIIPFKIVPIIQACDPVKFYEYSATGKPTVTTALPELSRVGDLTFFATKPSEFSEQIHNAYKQGKVRNFRKKLQEYAANNTWQHRTEQFIKVLEDMPKVSIIILSYGDPELTKAALSSLYERGASYPNMEIIIVDNGSPRDAVSNIKTFSDKYPSVSIIENGDNLGFAKGNNVGLEAATGQYIILLNNDTVVAPGAIHAMVRHLEHNPLIGAVGPLTNNIGNEAKLFVEYKDMKQMRSVARSATTGYRGIYTNIPVVAYFAVMFRKQDLKIFGLLSEEYGRGMFEDDDHCAVINSKGYICALAEDAFIHHHLSATFSTLKDDEKNELFDRNRRTFEERWGVWKAHQYREYRPKSSII